MAISFSGLACTPRIAGDKTTNQVLFVIENDRQSGVVVSIRRLMVFMDPGLGALTDVTPPVRGYRSSVDIEERGASLLSKGAFDTSQTSSAEVELWGGSTPDLAGKGELAATITAPSFGNMIARNHTAVEQVISTEVTLLPTLVSKIPYKLYPGQSYVVRVDAAAAASNPVTNTWMVNCCWQEEPVAVHAISGTVTNGGTGVVGAKVLVLIADDTSLTNAYLWATITTGAGGTWSCATIPDGKIAFAYAQHDAGGGTYYTAAGAPFVS